VAIRSFGDKQTRHFFENGKPSRGAGWSGVQAVVKRKLDMVYYTGKLDDLRSPPGNRVEALTGDLKGFHSIRVNDQWRIVFRWSAAGPVDVTVCAYH
jgi:toxin HigB-1